MMRTFISHLRYQLGELVPLGVALQGEERQRFEESMLALGYETCGVASGGADGLARRCVEEVFDLDPSLPSRLDAVLVGTRESQLHLSDILRSQSAANIPVVDIAGMECANMAAAISMADALVRSGSYRTILCCSACSIPENASRITSNRAGLLSDGAACCVVSAAESPLEICSGLLARSHTLASGARPLDDVVVYFSFCRDLLEQVRVRSNAPEHGFDHLVTLNVPVAFELLSRMRSVSAAKAFKANIPRTAHVSGVDVVINLKDLQEAGGRGDVLVGGLAPTSASFLHVRIRDV